MITVREVFVAKPGMASKLATKFRSEFGKESTVLTDLVGAYNTVVVETRYEDMAAFDKEMQEFAKQPRPAPDPSKPSHTEMYTEGRREIFRVW